MLSNMKVSVLQENLSEALGIILRNVANRPQLPVLANVLIDVKEGGMSVTGTDLEVGVVVQVNAKVESFGKVTVPARMFSEFISSLPAGTVEMRLLKETLMVESGSYSARFQTISAEEFPKMPEFDENGEGFIGLSLAEFSEAAERVVFAAAKDSMRPVLTGVLFEFKGKELTFIATDGFRLALRSFGIDKKAKSVDSFILPSRVVSEVSRLGGGELLGMQILSGSSQILFKQGDVLVVAQLLDGSFPDYQKIIPDNFETEVVVSREGLLQAVRSSLVFARDNSNVLKFEVGGKGIVIKSESPEQGENVVRVASKVEGEGGVVAFNGKFLLDFLSVSEADNIWFGMGSALSPGTFRDEGDEKFLYVVMPINL